MMNNHEPVSIVIVDDETEACENLSNLLNSYHSNAINILGVANSTGSAEGLINRVNPDAVFLDIEMPNENAFQFLERIAPVAFEVLFVTAYDEYAIRAFKLNAVDYLLKPISIPDLGSAVAKLAEKVALKRIAAASPINFSDLGNIVANRARASRITLKDGGSIDVVDFKDILFIEAQGSYSKVLFVKNGTVRDKTMSMSLSDYEDLVPPDLFFRIHKSYLINCAYVDKVLKEDYNQVIVARDYTLPVSRRRFSLLLDFLKSNNYHGD